ncbi:hypothetical protein CTI14_72375, partial [Methylobacterium radiotolerans]
AIPFIVLAVVFVLLAALLCALGVRRVVLRRTLGTVPFRSSSWQWSSFSSQPCSVPSGCAA